MFGILAAIIADHVGTATAMTDSELKSITELRLFLRANDDAGRWAIPLKKIKLEAVDSSIAVNSAVDSSTAANSGAEKMNRMQLRAYAGTYTLMSQFDLKVFVDDGKLMAQATGQGAFGNRYANPVLTGYQSLRLLSVRWTIRDADADAFGLAGPHRPSGAWCGIAQTPYGSRSSLRHRDFFSIELSEHLRGTGHRRREWDARCFRVTSCLTVIKGHAAAYM